LRSRRLWVRPPPRVPSIPRPRKVRTLSFSSEGFPVSLCPDMQSDNPQPERKSLDDRNRMTELERIRHSAAHVLATAILRLWPDAQFAAGPPVDTGFYYDVDLSHRISPEAFEKIEAEMKKEIKANNTFEKFVVTREQALKDAQAGRLASLGE